MQRELHLGRTARTAARATLVVCWVLSSSLLRGADPWVQVIGNGFGDKNNIQIAELHVFKGQIYAGGSRSAATGPGQLWRSADGQGWTQVTAFSPSLQSNQVASIISFGDSGGASPQFVYLGTNNASGSGSIYRSTEGTSWTQINGAGTGWVSTGNGFISPHLIVKDGLLYAGTQNASGAQVWRRPIDDSTGWSKVLDFASIDAALTSITYLYVFNNVIYVGTGIFQGMQPTGGTARIYSSPSGSAGTWAKNAGAGNGFGNTNNVALTSFVDFNNALYASTRNLITGGELFRSSDAITWTRVASNGLGTAGNIELHNLRVAQNQIWLATLSKSPALFQVWRSTDGANWVQSNVNGFGDANNTSTTGSSVGVTMGFGDFIYWGGTNEVTGAQVWRLAAGSIPVPVTMGVSPSALRFGAVKTPASATLTAVTPAQDLAVTLPGANTWTAAADQSWVQITSGSGTGSGRFTVSITNPSNVIGSTTSLTATITVTAPNATNSPASIPVTLAVYPPTTSAAPFGSWDTPANGTAGVQGSLAVTGWVLDDVGVTAVRVYRAAVGAEPAGSQILLGNAVLVTGARPDIEAANPTVPLNARAGWGYLLLTNMLPGQGNGPYTLFVYADDVEGHTTLLGTRTVSCSNQTATKPFGAIDTPGQGETVSGAAYVNFGWALTPLPKAIPVDGSTIVVFIDGVAVGTANYNQFRSDIATLFPGLANSNGASGNRTIDTTTLANGVHTIQWVVTDNAGVSEGIGSRYLSVQNSGSGIVVDSSSHDLKIAPTTTRRPDVTWRHGHDADAPLQPMIAHAAGGYVASVDALDRMEIRMSPAGRYRGHLVVGSQVRDLPIGSHLDVNHGVFTWHPGVAFFGYYDLLFVRADTGRDDERIAIRVVISGSATR